MPLPTNSSCQNQNLKIGSDAKAQNWGQVQLKKTAAILPSNIYNYYNCLIILKKIVLTWDFSRSIKIESFIMSLVHKYCLVGVKFATWPYCLLQANELDRFVSSELVITWSFYNVCLWNKHSYIMFYFLSILWKICEESLTWPIKYKLMLI